MDEAACGPDVAELFFVPPGRFGQLTEGNQEALRICRGCPVRMQCYEDAATSAAAEFGSRIAGGKVWRSTRASTAHDRREGRR